MTKAAHYSIRKSAIEDLVAQLQAKTGENGITSVIKLALEFTVDHYYLDRTESDES